jgi:excisionase family DNA binding protein
VQSSNYNRWLSIREAAGYLNMSVPFIRKQVRHRLIPFARVGSKALRFRREDLDRWLESNSCGGEISHSKYEGR